MNNLITFSGKMIAQCCHGAVSSYIKGKRTHSALLHQWEISSQAKIVVKVNNLKEMLQIEKVSY